MKNISKEPPILACTKEDIVAKMEKLSKSYTPEWHFSKENPDVGSVMALLATDLLQESIDILNASLTKHHIAFLNCLETNLMPALPAQCYVAFEMIPGIKEGQLIPKGTRIAARSPKGGDILFSTCHSVYASTCKPTAFFMTSNYQDKIINAYSDDRDLSELNLQCFHFEGEDQQSHDLYIAHPFLLSHTKEGVLQLTLDEIDKEALFVLSDPDRTRWCLLTNDGEKVVEPSINGNALLLKLIDIPEEPFLLGGIESYWLRARLKTKPGLDDVPSASISSMKLSISKAGILPETIYTQDIEWGGNSFKPFGERLQIYAESYIRCDEAFAKKGATIEMHFNLEYTTVENKLEMPELPVQYKYIMRRPKERQVLQPIAIKADEVSFEYWNGTGWVRLFKEGQYQTLFNGQKEGKVCITFKCPNDIEPIAIGAFETTWLRLRLIQADHLYTNPSIEYIPQIKELFFNYYYDDGLMPQSVLTMNNVALQDITYEVTNHEAVRLFKPCPFNRPSLLIGFDELPSVSPLCLFMAIENRDEWQKDKITFSYSTLRNDIATFRDLKVSDGTKGLTVSGNMMIILPKDFCKTNLFGEEKYWLRLENTTSDDEHEKQIYPIIKGIYMNTAKVINKVQEEEKHYVVERSGEIKLQLAHSNVIDVEVYIDERPRLKEERLKLLLDEKYDVSEEKNEKGELISFWVKWKKCESVDELKEEERNYYIDYFSHEIIFPNNIFTYFPINEEYQAIKVKYALCDGKQAEVGIGAINNLEQPISFISKVYNPIAAFGSSNYETIEQAAYRTAKFLENRGKVVTLEDYETAVYTFSSTVRRVKCVPHMNQWGQRENMSLSIIILEEDFEKGAHVLNSYKEALKVDLLARSDRKLLQNKLYIREPEYVTISASVWIIVNQMENAYEYQEMIKEHIEKFLHPITGNFNGKGWEIGSLPRESQLDAYLKSLRLKCPIKTIILTAQITTANGNKICTLKELSDHPFALPISGEHEVNVDVIIE